MTEFRRLVESLHRRTAALEKQMALQTRGGSTTHERPIQQWALQEFYDKYKGDNPGHKFCITKIDYDDNMSLDVETKGELLDALLGKRFEGTVRSITDHSQHIFQVTGGPRPRFWTGHFTKIEEVAKFIDGIIDREYR